VPQLLLQLVALATVESNLSHGWPPPARYKRGRHLSKNFCGPT
jgi:hypothetical protein